MDTLLRRREMMVRDTAPAPIFHARLVFDGQAAIATDIPLPSDGSIRFYTCGRETVKAAQAIFCSQNDASQTVLGIALSTATTSTTRTFLVRYASTSAVSNNKTLDFSTNSYGLFMTPNGFGLGASFYSFTKGSVPPTKGLIFGLGMISQKFTGQIGRVWIYGADAKNCQSNSAFDSFTPVASLRPCTYLGEAGLWCVETSTFYGNTAGVGTLSVAD